MNVLEITQLNKKFGTKKVLDDLNMVVPQNTIFGFIGENGSGKTTTMKLILGLIKADSGNVLVNGEKVTYGDTKTNRHIGYLSDVPEFYDYMTPMEYLLLCGEITGLAKKESLKKSRELLELVGLDDANKKIKTFSRGMKQRLGIAQALLNEPKLLICDEPTSALDPIGRKQILDILLAIKGKTTVVFSTHILSDVERVCDHVAFLHGGKIALHGSLQDIRSDYSQKGFIITFSNKEQLTSFLQSKALTDQGMKLSTHQDVMTIMSDDTKKDGQFLLQVLAQLHIVPLKFEQIEPSLENLFAEVVR